MPKPKVRDQEIEGLVDGVWASVLYTMTETRNATQSQYNFMILFVEYFAHEDGCDCPTVEGRESDYFHDNILGFLNKLSLDNREKAHIMGSLFERLTTEIARPQKVGT